MFNLPTFTHDALQHFLSLATMKEISRVIEAIDFFILTVIILHRFRTGPGLEPPTLLLGAIF
jgi:hypothetical protein